MEKDMSKRRIRNLLLLITATVAVLGYGGIAQAKTDPPPPVAIEVLTPRAVFTDHVKMRVRVKAPGRHREFVKVSNPSRIVTTRVTVQPGAQIPWHTHPGPVFVTIAEGELTYVSSDHCNSRRYTAGNAFVDPGHGHVHTAYNSGKTVTVFLATFFEAPETGPISIPADAPANCQIPPR
jgi:quercetin dioxygenase-like cupin family protein